MCILLFYIGNLIVLLLHRFSFITLTKHGFGEEGSKRNK